MIITHIKTIIIALVIYSVSTLGYAESGNKVVATVFGEPVLLMQLEPVEQKMSLYRAGNPELTEPELKDKARADKLSSLIWQALIKELAKHNDIEPSDEEVNAFSEFMGGSQSDMTKEMLSELTQDEVAEYEAQVYQSHKNYVRTYKLSKVLYEKYGGVVVFQQANPLEPVGAYKAFLKDSRANGHFEIFHEQMKTAFWQVLNKPHSFIVPEEKVDFSKPWWLQTAQQEQ